MLAPNAMAPISIERVSGFIGFPNQDRTATFLPDIQGMEADSSQICDRFRLLTRVFLQLSATGSPANCAEPRRSCIERSDGQIFLDQDTVSRWY